MAAPDKFRGTASAAAVADAIGAAAWEAGWDADLVPLADGGEGLLDVFGGANRSTRVAGPLGSPVEAPWRMERRGAVVESAHASGLGALGPRVVNDPLAATSAGTGELIGAAIDAGARRIVVGVGGSACTDGGLGAVEVLGGPARLRGVDVIVACDVRTAFVDAAEVFAPQKGATPPQVALLTRRLEQLADRYLSSYGVDVCTLEGAGAAGGLAGGLAAIGAQLVPGFDLVADEVGFEERVIGADLVVTGEGFVDAQSYEGKVVGGVADVASRHGVPVLVVAGQVFDAVDDRAATVSLRDRFGLDRAMTQPLRCVREVVAADLATRRVEGPR